MSKQEEQPAYRSTNKFDLKLQTLEELPDVTRTKPTTLTFRAPIVGDAQTFIVQTLRQKDMGDTIFLQYIDADTSFRIVIPSEVADTIARQRDALTTRVRRRVGRDQAAARKARGELPGFMKGGKRHSKRSKKS